MPSETLISFDDFAPQTVVEAQYLDRGVEFRAPPDGDLPRIQLTNGKQVLLIRTCKGEFCPSAVVGQFTRTRRRVRVLVGNLKPSPSVEDVTLSAYDASGQKIMSVSASVAGGGEVATPLEISLPAAEIDSFEVRAYGFHTEIAIDDLSFDVEEGPGVPDFGIRLEGTQPVGVRQGSSTTARFRLNRANGSEGPIRLEVSGLPDGVSATFSPPIANAESQVTLTLAALPTATAGSVPIVVTATPQTAGAGTTVRKLEIPLFVAAAFAVAPLTMEVPPCTRTSGSVTVYAPLAPLSSPNPGLIPIGNLASPVHLALFSLSGSPLPPGVEVSFEPAALSLKGLVQATATVQVRAAAGSLQKECVVSILATCDPYPPALASLTLRPVAGALEGFAPRAGTAPQTLQPGSEITLTGTGFCPESSFPIEVRFGNASATAKPTWVSADGRKARVRVPRLATDGPLSVVTPVGTFRSRDSFVVSTHRNTHGLPFTNPPLHNVSYDDLSEIFGKSQVYLTVTLDPCAPIPFIPSCPIAELSIIPNPLSALVLLIAQKIPAHCFGMSLATERLRRGATPLAAFSPPDARTSWQLESAAGAFPMLGHHLRIQSLAQLGAEVLHLSAARVSEGFATPQPALVIPIHTLIRADLQAGKHPLILMRDGGTGHVVVAYDLEDGDKPGVAYYIHVYDPNTPFIRNENVDEADHVKREKTVSRITIYHSGMWEFAFPGWKPFFFFNFSQSFVVVPYDALPLNPTFLASLEGIATFVFGAAEITQVSDAEGHSLLTADGRLNPDPGTRLLGAAPWAPFSQRAASASAPGFILADGGAYHWRARGTGSGEYSNVAVGSGFGVHLPGVAVSSTTEDEISVHAAEASFGFRTSDVAKPLRATVIAQTDGDGSVRTAVVETTSHRGGFDSITFDRTRAAVSYRHEGEPTSFTLGLSRSGGSAMPSSFMSPLLKIGRGDVATFRPTDWDSLADGQVQLTLVRPGGKQEKRMLRSSVEFRTDFSIVRLSVDEAAERETRLNVVTRWEQVTEDTEAVVMFVVIRGRSVVSSSQVTLPVGHLRPGLRTDSWMLPRLERGNYRFVTFVSAIARRELPVSLTRREAASFKVR